MIVIYASAFYIIIWWTVLFIVLPWGVKSVHEDENAHPLHEPGAPIVPHIKRKFLATTLISAIVLAFFYLIGNILYEIGEAFQF